jgi:enediyne polyketide synthase
VKEDKVAIVGMACIYPDARTPIELWENVLAQRRSFRRIPAERLRLEDYFSSDHSTPDHTYSTEAALIEGYDFDRLRFRVAGSTYRSTDLTHWLALDVAAQALADAGFPDGHDLPRESTGVIVGNTLTGEFSRANVMRLRWPYVRRVIANSLIARGWSSRECQELLSELEIKFKLPFPEIGEETLAGGLSNTIAGRICNHFDLKGGGYTVDGACASSLLSVITACTALTNGDLDLAIAGGVDLSIDPFELVGFAKAGALAADEMTVYDAHSAGFWPGEGCGMVTLMRESDARMQGRKIYALICGWGISSDGSGGITRPEVEGQLLALKRAYQRARVDIGSVTYFEGHGTGTSVGDATELQTLARFRQEACADAPKAFIGTIKANIGHTKAAAGIAGLIKASMALQYQVIPPTTGCKKPHEMLTRNDAVLQVLDVGQAWPRERPVRAAVSAMGFGGINTHLILEGITKQEKVLDQQERILLASAQDSELILLSAPTADALSQLVTSLLDIAAHLSIAELGDLAAELAESATNSGFRAALIASSPKELIRRLEILQAWLTNGVTSRLDVDQEIFVGITSLPPRIGFLFSGQGSPVYLSGGALRRRFETIGSLYLSANLPRQINGFSTDVAQPAIVAASLASLRVLEQLQIYADLAIGHSLGELTALYWAGAFEESTVLRIAETRGRAMAEKGDPQGAMASLHTDAQTVTQLIVGEEVTIACLNSPRETIVSGSQDAIEAVVSRSRAAGVQAIRLRVSHAFHSPLIAAAVPTFCEYLVRESFQPLKRRVISTVTGEGVHADEDICSLLVRQITAPVHFLDAFQKARSQVDLWLEVGPGHVLSSLVAKSEDTVAIPLDAGGPSLRGLLQAVGAVFVLGGSVNVEALFINRFTRPFDLSSQPKFFTNPCELIPLAYPLSSDSVEADPSLSESLRQPENMPAPETVPENIRQEDTLSLVRRLVAQRAELPTDLIKPGDRLLSNLHLNSITVGQIVVEAAQNLGLLPPAFVVEYADATVEQVAQSLEELKSKGGSLQADQRLQPPGVDTWIRAFTVELLEQPLKKIPVALGKGNWTVLSTQDDPLRAELVAAFAKLDAGSGVVLCVPPKLDEAYLSLLLEAARIILAENGPSHFVLVQRGESVASLARTLHLEAPRITVCVVNIPPRHPHAANWVVAETLSAEGYIEAYYDIYGRRSVPISSLLPMSKESIGLPIGSDDVLLVTGGGKGITAECALALAVETGARLVILGRSKQEEDPALAANLKRIESMGAQLRYFQVDITDREALQLAVREADKEFGPITAILHGAARNEPKLLRVLSETDMHATLAPKIKGLENLLAAVCTDKLRLLVAFGSIIARTGLPGEADYALANEWLVHAVEHFQDTHSSCRCLAVEWSVWSGIGMGERLSRVEALARQGVVPIPPEEGIKVLLQLLKQRLPSVSVIVTGRFGNPPTLQLAQPELPFLRFLERPRVYFPGIELVVDSELSSITDPYMNEHVLHKEHVFPAVMGLEAMAEAAMALTGTNQPPIFESVKFNRPVIVPDGETLVIRLAALLREPNQVEVSLRCETTAFQVDHFQALCRFLQDEKLEEIQEHIPSDEELPLLNIDPQRDLYGKLLFHTGRFQRVGGYRRLSSKECLADITADGDEPWFGPYLPPSLVLPDPGMRDAAIHVIQACIPFARLMPVGLERLVHRPFTQANGPWRVYAREQQRQGDLFWYDVDVLDANGQLAERWQGLQLKQIEVLSIGVWSSPLFVPYLERRLSELLPTAQLRFALEEGEMDDRKSGTDQAIQRLFGEGSPIYRRPDGKLESGTNVSVVVAHAANLTLAIAGPPPIGCDLELIVSRPEAVWQGLLGMERIRLAKLIAQETAESLDQAATRVWAAGECLKKSGAIPYGPLSYLSSTPEGWVLLTAGSLSLATLRTSLRDVASPYILAVLVEKGNESLFSKERIPS